MNPTKSKFVYRFSLIMVILLSGLFVSDQAAVYGAPSGEITTVAGSGVFTTKGGDPATGNGAFPLLSQTVFDSLISVTPEQKYIPALAKSWKIGPNWKYIEFTLREDVKFHNGDPMTAEDIKFTLETYMKKDLRFWLRRLYEEQIGEIQILGPYHIRINLKKPYPWFFTNLWYQTGMVPKKYRTAVGDEEFAKKPVGTGPFTWVEYKQDEYYKLQAIKSHFRKTPEIKTLNVRFVPEESTRLAILQSGEAEIVALSGPHIPIISSDPNLRVHFIKHTMGVGLWFSDLAFPETPSPFHDIRVREAASLAIDREAICKKILFGASEPMRDYLPPITLGHDPKIKSDPYNPQRAKALLAEAGYPNGFKTSLHVLTTAKTWAEAVSDNLRTVGIDTDIQIYEMGALLTRFRSKKLTGLGFPGIIWWNPGPHPGKEGTNWFVRGQTWCYNSTPEIEAAVEKTLTAETDPEIAEAGRAMSRLVRESRLMLPLFANHSVYGLSSKIKEWEPVAGVPNGTRYEYLKLQN